MSSPFSPTATRPTAWHRCQQGVPLEGLKFHEKLLFYLISLLQLIFTNHLYLLQIRAFQGEGFPRILPIVYFVGTLPILFNLREALILR